MDTKVVWLGAGVLVRPLDPISTAAVDNMPTQQHASPLIIPPFSSGLVQELIAMHMMMAPALSPAKLMNMTLFSVPTAIGMNTFFWLGSVWF